MIVRVNGDRAALWCPACDNLHVISLGARGWGIQREYTDRPTITPSIKVGGVQWPTDSAFHKPKHHVEPGQSIVCHSFVTDGSWQFLGDCTHDLAGQTVPCVPIPDGWFEDES